MKLSIVTVTYKSDVKELDLFIQSFFKYNDLGEDAKLVIVDNSPSDYANVHDLIQQSYNDIVCYISNPSNPGFGASNNVGFKSFKTEYVLFINNDVEFQEPVFKTIISKFEENPNVGCYGIHQNGGAPSFFNKMTAPKNTQLDKFDENVHFISGAFMWHSCISPWQYNHVIQRS